VKLGGQFKDFSVTNRFNSPSKVPKAWFIEKEIKKRITNKLILSKDWLGDAISDFRKEKMIGSNLWDLNWNRLTVDKLFSFWRIRLLFGCVGSFSQQSNIWHWSSCHFSCSPCKDVHMSHFETQFNFSHKGFLHLLCFGFGFLH
jgi:hypothetical protein